MSKNKMRNHNYPEPNVTSSNIIFCLTNSPKPQNISFMVVNYKEKQQTLVF